jgi:hypothetical protein
MAKKHVWWLPPTQALARPHLVAAQVMNLGEYEDVRGLEATLGRERLVEALRGEGWFNRDARPSDLTEARTISSPATRRFSD